MSYVKNVVVEIKKASKGNLDLIESLRRKEIVQTAQDDKCIMIARYQVNKITLRRLLADHKMCTQ